MWNYDENWINSRVGPLFKSRYTQAGRLIGDDAGYCVWPSRVIQDIQVGGMDPELSLAKHDRELCEALGITLPFPQAPSQSMLQFGETTAQGLTVHTSRYGDMPWWPGCWAWLDRDTRHEIAPQLLANGDEILLIMLPVGDALYDEPAPNFYTADKFGPLDVTHGLTQVDPVFVGLIEEAIGELGFKGVWIALPGEAGPMESNGHCQGFNRCMALRTPLIHALAASTKADLNPYCAKLLMWDGVFYGWSQAELGEWFNTSFALDPWNLYGMEHSTAHIPDGEAVAAWQPYGNMYHCKLLLGEFNDGQFDDTVWQILPRCMPPGTYKRPPEQPAGDDPRPPYHLVNGCAYRVFEYHMYDGVRGQSNAVIQADKQKFVDMGAAHVC